MQVYPPLVQLFMNVNWLARLCPAPPPPLCLQPSIQNAARDVACKIEVLMANWPQLCNNEKPPNVSGDAWIIYGFLHSSLAFLLLGL